MLLASGWIDRLRAAAAAPMARVSAATGESVMVGQLLGDTVVPIAWHPPRNCPAEFASKLTELGPSYPLWATATGRAMLGKLGTLRFPLTGHPPFTLTAPSPAAGEPGPGPGRHHRKMAEAPVPAQPARGPAAPGPAAPGPAAALGQRRRDLVITGLAMATGSLDAISFLGLGGVFTSVMTANMVLLGLSAGQRNGALALHAGVALAGFVAGGLAASRFARVSAEPPPAEPRPDGRRPDERRPDERPPAEPRPAEPRPAWPRRVTVVLVVETAVLAAVTVGWETAAARPKGNEQLVLVAAAAIAMGIQSAAVRALGVPGLSTTYLTGTLTTVLGDLAAVRASAALRRRLAILVMLVTGAAVSGILVWQAPRLAPVVPLGILIGVIAMAAFSASVLAAAPPEEQPRPR